MQQPRIKLTSEIIEGFANSLLSQRFDEPAPTPDCHREWWDLCCSSYRRVAIAAPRGHAKSTAITKAFVLASVLFRIRRNVLIISDTYQQAVQFLGEIKREFEVNEDLKEIFEFEGYETDREDEIVVSLRNGEEKPYQFRIKAYGSEQKVRGAIWDGMRPDMIVGDDMENDELVMNPERREKFKNWILNALLPTLSAKGIVRLIGTILHMGAYLELVMPKDSDENTIVLPLKSIMKKPKDGWFGVRYRAHDEDWNEVLWPFKWTKERLQEVQALYRAQGNPEGYFQEYLNRPIDPSNAFFKKEDFVEFSQKEYESDQAAWQYCPTYLSVDGAWSTKERRDWTVLTVGSTDESGMLYIRYILRDRMDTKEAVDAIVRLHERFKFPIMLIGKGAYEKGIAPFLQDYLSRKGKFLYCEAIPENQGDKRLRAQSIRGRMRMGGVKFNKQASWYPAFEQEMLEFDRGQHDDQVDTMAQFGMYLDQMQDAPTIREIRDYEWDEEFKSEDDWNLGKCESTGY